MTINIQEECKQLLDLAMNGKHLARCDVVNFNWEIEGLPVGAKFIVFRTKIRIYVLILKYQFFLHYKH